MSLCTLIGSQINAYMLKSHILRRPSVPPDSNSFLLSHDLSKYSTLSIIGSLKVVLFKFAFEKLTLLKVHLKNVAFKKFEFVKFKLERLADMRLIF
jgi:hypothetical protein